MRETWAMLVKIKILLNMKKFIILHAKNFPTKILFNKKFFDFSQILRQQKKHFEIKFLNFSSKSDNFLLNKLFGQSPDVGVKCVTSVSDLFWDL